MLLVTRRSRTCPLPSLSLQTLREEQANLDLLLRRVNAGSVIGERHSSNGETRGKPAFGASIDERLHGWVGRSRGRRAERTYPDGNCILARKGPTIRSSNRFETHLHCYLPEFTRVCGINGAPSAARDCCRHRFCDKGRDENFESEQGVGVRRPEMVRRASSGRVDRRNRSSKQGGAFLGLRGRDHIATRPRRHAFTLCRLCDSERGRTASWRTAFARRSCSRGDSGHAGGREMGRCRIVG